LAAPEKLPLVTRKATVRKSYSFRTFHCVELAPYHSLGKLPMPESAHGFF